MTVPTYEYRCISCEHQFERFQRMSDDPVKECEVCGEPVMRLLFPVAIHFKGSGFYSTDYAKRNRIATGGSTNSAAASESNSGGRSCTSETSSTAESSKSENTASEATKAVTSATKND